MTMWKDVREMSKEEIASELENLKKVREISTKVTVDKVLFLLFSNLSFRLKLS